MTNLFLTITIATNIGVTKIEIHNTDPTHIYSFQHADVLPIMPTTNWVKDWIFTSERTLWYDYTDTNRFYRVQDLGTRF